MSKATHANDNDPSWAKPAALQNENLPIWFLKHRDTGLRNLPALAAPEFAITSFHFSTARIPPSRVSSCGVGFRCLKPGAFLFV